MKTFCKKPPRLPNVRLEKCKLFFEKINNFFRPKFIDINGQKVTKKFPWFSISALFFGIIIFGVVIWAVKPDLSNPNSHHLFWKNIGNFFDFKTINVAGVDYTPLGTFKHALSYLWRTISFSILGTLLGIVLSIPMALLCSKNFIKTPIVYIPMRIFMSMVRAVPPIVFAFIFNFLVSKELAATFSLAIFVSSIMAKWLYEDLDTYDASNYQALQSFGNTKLVAFKNSIMPYLNKRIFAYGFYSFEMVVRFAAVLSIVGIPTIGESVDNYQEVDKFGGLTIVLWTLITFVVLLEILNFIIKKFFLEATPKHPKVDEKLGYNDYLKALKKQKPKTYLWKVFLFIGITALAIAAFFQIKFQLANKASITFFKSGIKLFFSPDWSVFDPKNSVNVFHLGFEALAVAIVSSLIGLVLAVPVAILASFNITSWGSLIFKLMIIVLRAIPAFTFAILFRTLSSDSVVFAGTLALGIHSIGMMGKLTTQAIEKIPKKFFESLDSMGSNVFIKFKETFKEVFPIVMSHFLYRIEINYKSTTVIGAVGASRFGFQLNIYSSDTDSWNILSSYLLFTIVLLITLEYISSLLRKRILDGYFFKEDVWFKKLIRFHNGVRALAYARTLNIDFNNHKKTFDFINTYGAAKFDVLYDKFVREGNLMTVNHLSKVIYLRELYHKLYTFHLTKIKSEIAQIKANVKWKILNNKDQHLSPLKLKKVIKKSQMYAINHYFNEQVTFNHV
ncbi:PhnE/PtxC family ABC transporter permease [Ureaplasma canigenitalium]|uniref:PhnE/PtxC family ABC transporter permease n=1 Tax=Ureaplasma canigenitalium TaxID=42092 RepID=UPI00068AC2E6|nr:ABC transporter permease subunit [Ureaplasma canigenitalium]